MTEVADAYGVSRQAVHRWLSWYRGDGMDGLADGSNRPQEHPWQIDAAVEAAICRKGITGRRYSTLDYLSPATYEASINQTALSQLA